MKTPIDGDLRQLLRRNIPGHWQHIESATTGQGIPDCNACVEGHEFWVECKATRAWAVHFQPTQIAWLLQRTRAGGHVWVAVRRWRCTDESIDELWVVPGRLADLLAAEGLREVAPLAVVWSGGPRHWVWNQVCQLLVS